MSLRLSEIPEQLRSLRFLYAVGAIVTSYALFSLPLLPVSSPKQISSTPSLRNVEASNVVKDLKKLYPEDLYPGSSYFRGPHGEVGSLNTVVFFYKLIANVRHTTMCSEIQVQRSVQLSIKCSDSRSFRSTSTLRSC